MTHVLFIQPNLEGIGGIEKVVPRLAQAYQEEGNEVSCFVLYGQVPKEQIFWKHVYALKEGTTKNFFHRIYKIFLRVQELARYSKQVKSDCIVVSAQGASIIVVCAKMLGYINQPVIVYVHQSICETDTMYNRLLIKFLYRYADGFLCVSKGIEIEVLQEIKGAHGKTGTAYNTLSSKEEHTLSEEDTAFCMSLAQPVYVTASRLEKIKGVDMLVDIFITYLENSPGTLLIIGDGSLRKDLETKIAQHDLRKRIICIGYKDNPQKYMAHAQVYVSCARSEAFGISLIEALSQGVPVIATDVPYGPKEICDIQDVSPVKYPLVGNYGILFSDLVEIDTMTTRFIQAITKLNGSLFEQDILKQRASYFSKEKQLKVFNDLIERVLENPRV